MSETRTVVAECYTCDPESAFVCAKCGAPPDTFGTNNLRFAACPDPDCSGGVWKARDLAVERTRCRRCGDPGMGMLNKAGRCGACDSRFAPTGHDVREVTR